MRLLTTLAAVVFGLGAGLLAGQIPANSSPSDINIHNVVKTFDPLECTVTITWDTDECTTTNLVRWDGSASCAGSPTYPNTVHSSLGAGRSHSVVIDHSAGPPAKTTFQIESSNACDTQTSSCMSITSSPCIQ